MFKPDTVLTVRIRNSIIYLIKKWHPPAYQKYGLYEEDVALWDYIVAKGREENKDIQNTPMTQPEVRLCIEFVRNVVNEVEFIVKDLREKADAKMIEYMNWEKSEPGKFCFRLEDMIEKRRVKRQYSKVRQALEKGIEENNFKAIELWAKLTGKYVGEIEDKETTPIVIVDEYKDGERIEKTIQVPVSDALKTKQEKRGKQGMTEKKLTIEEVEEQLA